MSAESERGRWLLPAVLIFIAAAASLLAFWQFKATSALRAENQALRQAEAEMNELRLENAQLEQWRSTAAELEKLRKDNLELNRLRNEIRQLRSQAPEMEQLRAENQRLQGVSQQLLSQKKAVESQLAQASVDHAAVLALKAQADADGCVNQLKQIVLAARVWAADHNDVFPPDFASMSQTLNHPGLLLCPSDTDRAAAANWQQFQASNASYALVAPGARTDDPTKVFVQCPLHGHVGMADGSVQKAAPPP